VVTSVSGEFASVDEFVMAKAVFLKGAARIKGSYSGERASFLARRVYAKRSEVDRVTTANGRRAKE